MALRKLIEQRLHARNIAGQLRVIDRFLPLSMSGKQPEQGLQSVLIIEVWNVRGEKTTQNHCSACRISRDQSREFLEKLVCTVINVNKRCHCGEKLQVTPVGRLQKPG